MKQSRFIQPGDEVEFRGQKVLVTDAIEFDDRLEIFTTPLNENDRKEELFIVRFGTLHN